MNHPIYKLIDNILIQNNIINEKFILNPYFLDYLKEIIKIISLNKNKKIHNFIVKLLNKNDFFLQILINKIGVLLFNVIMEIYDEKNINLQKIFLLKKKIKMLEIKYNVLKIDWTEENILYYLNKIDWEELFKYPEIIRFYYNLMKKYKNSNNILKLLEKNLVKINWDELSCNIDAIDILEKNINNINWDKLSSNYNAIDILKNNMDKINWDELSLNKNAIELLKKNPNKINWKNISLNIKAIDIIEKNLDKICFEYLSLNPEAIHILKLNIDKINWDILSLNPKGLEILINYTDNINWELISISESIFKLNYDIMTKNFEFITEEIIAGALHPKRIVRLMYEYNFDIEEWFD